MHLVKIVPEDNQRRYYHMRIVRGLFGDWGLVREWGRIGRAGQGRTDWFDCEADAEDAQETLAQQKGRRGYGNLTPCSDSIGRAFPAQPCEKHNILWPDSLDSAKILSREE